MELTTAQLRFLSSLSRAPIAASHNVDAGMAGPLIRANLIRWEDDAATLHHKASRHAQHSR
jgi:hypothetical protein